MKAPYEIVRKFSSSPGVLFSVDLSLFIYVYLYLISTFACGAQGNHKRASYPLELELDNCKLPCGC